MGVDLGLSGRKALVTAASKGLGRACAEALSGEGAKVFISSRDPVSIESAGKAMGAAGWQAADVSNAGALEAMVEAALAKLSPHGLIVADNTLRDGTVLDPGDDEAARVMDDLNTRWATDERVVAVQLTVRDGLTLVRRR